MSWTDLLYLTKARAKEYGFTHEGSIYGVPAYLVSLDAERVGACPKIVVLQLYSLFMDYMFGFMAYFCSEDTEITTPIVFGSKL